MKLKRLWQPTSLVFWLMVAFNVLSSVGAWVLRAVALPRLAVIGPLSALLSIQGACFPARQHGASRVGIRVGHGTPAAGPLLALACDLP